MDANSKLNVSELDFNDIKQNLSAFLQSQDEFKNFNFQGTSIDVLLDVLSYNTHYNAFYMNMLANEMFLETASLRSSIVSRARSLGYTPRSISSSRAVVDVEIIPTDTPVDVTIPKHTLFRSTLDDQTFTFVNQTALTVLPSNGRYISTDVELKQGIPLTHRYVYDPTNVNQKFTLPNLNSDTETLAVSIQTSNTDSTISIYSKASDITAVNSTSNVYFLEENREGNFEITFGDDVIGRKLVDGNIVILETLVTDGENANRCAVFNVSEISGYDDVVLTTKSVATGGSTKENTKSIKYNAPRRFETQNRAVTRDDYKRILEENYPGGDAIIVWGGEDNDPPVYGKVFVSIKPKTGLYLSDAEKNYIKNDILKPKSIAAITTEVLEPFYTNIIVDSTVKFNPNKTNRSSAQLKALVETVVSTYGTDQLNLFNQVFRFSNLSTKIDVAETSILSSLTTVKLKSKILVGNLNLGVASNYTIKFNNEIYHPSENYEGALTSTKFTHPDGQNVQKTDCYVVDVNGTLKVKRVDGNQIFTIQENIGTIDYGTGNISFVGFAPSAIVGSTFDLIAIPASSDIIPKNNQILLIDSQDVTIKMINDFENSILGSNTAVSGASSGGVAGSGGSSSGY